MQGLLQQVHSLQIRPLEQSGRFCGRINTAKYAHAKPDNT
jgi:regulator of RNase E activity RraA